MSVLVWIIFILLLVVVILYHRKVIEGFHSVVVPISMKQEEDINGSYQQVLGRQPTPKEHIKSMRSLEDGESLKMLHRRLIDSDEYARLIKTQSDDLYPEIHKMLYDRVLIKAVRLLYKHALGKNLNRRLSLPLKDVYIRFDYNPVAFQCMLISKNYGRFESDIERNEKLKPRDLQTTFESYFEIAVLQKQAESLIMKQKASARGGFVVKGVDVLPYNKDVNQFE